MRRVQKSFHALLSASVLCVVATATGWSQSLTWLGTLGGSESWASGVSADGRVVVGWAYKPHWQMRAFRWTAEGGMQDLGTLGGDVSVALGVSADGSVVVGWAHNADYHNRAFRWENGVVQDLGTLGGVESWASGVSPDGSVVVGWARDAVGERAFRWTAAGGMQDLGTLGGYWSRASGVSPDGLVVVGVADNANWIDRAFLWTAVGGMQDLGTLPGGYRSGASGVSADGRVVVGSSDNAAGNRRAFLWTAAGGMQDLGTLPGGNSSWASGVSPDGQVVVGSSLYDGQNRAFRWTADSGMEDLNITCAHLLTSGSSLEVARAISPDGRYIVGTGWNAATGRQWEAFRLDVGVFRISGKIRLGDFDGDPTLIPITVQLRQNGRVARSVDLTTDADGNYTISDVVPGTYKLAFKASHWLRRVVHGVRVAKDDVKDKNVSLINGDVDGDNEVTLFHFGWQVAAFGSVPGDENWNADADLDGDEEVTLFDFVILVRNFGAIGDD
jgi:probable HAF family extracellular repeat protein